MPMAAPISVRSAASFAAVFAAAIAGRASTPAAPPVIKDGMMEARDSPTASLAYNQASEMLPMSL